MHLSYEGNLWGEREQPACNLATKSYKHRGENEASCSQHHFESLFHVLLQMWTVLTWHSDGYLRSCHVTCALTSFTSTVCKKVMF